MREVFKSTQLIRISEIIDLERLEHESRKYLYFGLLLGVVLHIIVGMFITYKKPVFFKTENDRKFIKVDLIVLPPKVKNPYEEWGKSISKRTYIRKKFKFRLPVEEFKTKPFITLEKSKKYHIDTDILMKLKTKVDISDTLETSITRRLVEHESKYRDLKISKEPKNHLSLLEEMVNLEDIDQLNMYKGFVIQDLTDKKNIKGFLHVPRYIYGIMKGNCQDYNLSYALNGLAEAFNYFTGIEFIVDDPISFSSPELIKFPVVYVTSDTTFDLSNYEVERFGEYLRNGGFAIVDNGRPWNEYTPTKASMINLLIQALGKDFRFDLLIPDHPVYHSFFDFGGLPPNGAEKWTQPVENKTVGWEELLHNPKIDIVRKKIYHQPYALWGIYIEDRLVAIYSDKGYGHYWWRGAVANKYRDFYSSYENKYNINPQLKIGVNMIILALIQRDSITKQYVDYYSHMQNNRFLNY